jgi:hypothetical protein
MALRQFCRLHPQPAPGDTNRLRWAHLVGVEVLAVLNERVVALIRPLRAMRGYKLWIGSVVVEMS